MSLLGEKPESTKARLSLGERMADDDFGSGPFRNVIAFFGWICVAFGSDLCRELLTPQPPPFIKYSF